MKYNNGRETTKISFSKSFYGPKLLSLGGYIQLVVLRQQTNLFFSKKNLNQYKYAQIDM